MIEPSDPSPLEGAIMEVVFGLIATLVAVVGVVTGTVVISRHMPRGRTALWAGTALMCTYWLVNFGYVAFQAGSDNDPGAVTVAIRWTAYALTLLGALGMLLAVALVVKVPFTLRGARTVGRPAESSDTEGTIG